MYILYHVINDTNVCNCIIWYVDRCYVSCYYM